MLARAFQIHYITLQLYENYISFSHLVIYFSPFKIDNQLKINNYTFAKKLIFELKL